jgi:glycosyltransferase involved in cell wall biosynthesis
MFERQAALSDAGARIHFEGFQRNPMRYLLSADVFALPSHHDTYPLVISEAREAGCAIVATNVDGIPELLDFGRAGVLVPPFDAGLLACAITRLLSDEQERLKWAARAKENLESRTVERMAERVCEVYERLLDSRGFCAKRAMKSRTESDAVETN